MCSGLTFASSTCSGLFELSRTANAATAHRLRLCASFRADDAYYVTVFKHGFFAYPRLVPRIHRVKEAFSKFRVDNVGELTCCGSLRNEVGVRQDTAVVIAQVLHVLDGIDGYHVEQLEVSGVYGLLHARRPVFCQNLFPDRLLRP